MAAAAAAAAVLGLGVAADDGSSPDDSPRPMLAQLQASALKAAQTAEDVYSELITGFITSRDGFGACLFGCGHCGKVVRRSTQD